MALTNKNTGHYRKQLQIWFTRFSFFAFLGLQDLPLFYWTLPPVPHQLIVPCLKENKIEGTRFQTDKNLIFPEFMTRWSKFLWHLICPWNGIMLFCTHAILFLPSLYGHVELQESVTFKLSRFFFLFIVYMRSIGFMQRPKCDSRKKIRWCFLASNA